MIDVTKEYRTRGGLAVRVYATDGGGEYPVHGAYCVDGQWFFSCWRADGSFTKSETSDFDLIEIKPRIKREYWINVYSNRVTRKAYGHKSKEEADLQAGHDRTDCVPVIIDCEEGEGR